MRTVLLALAALALPFAAAAADCGADLKGAQKVESARYVVAYRTQPGKIVIGKHFAMDLAICPKGSNPAADGVQINAQMPEHGHGMNYTPTVKPAGAGRFHAEGLMFHMHGRWELTFDVKSGGKTERATHNLTLE
jgi:hypothetical protein